MDKYSKVRVNRESRLCTLRDNNPQHYYEFQTPKFYVVINQHEQAFSMYVC